MTPTINNVEEEWTNINKAMHKIAIQVFGKKNIFRKTWFENVDNGNNKQFKKTKMHVRNVFKNLMEGNRWRYTEKRNQTKRAVRKTHQKG